jgi:hypothetical protein
MEHMMNRLTTQFAILLIPLLVFGTAQARVPQTV